MEEIMICIFCKKEIKDKENHIELIEWDNRKLIRTDYAHKSCWNIFVDEKKQRGMVRKMTMGLVGRANKIMNKAEEVYA